MRASHDLRPLSFETGVQLNADGSCLIKAGNTHVLCSISLEERVPGWMKGKGKGWLTAEYGMLPGATHTRTDREAAKGKQQGRTVEIQRLIGRSLRQAVDLQILGERQITLDCDVLNADGGTRCAAITGGWVALVLALRKHGLESALVRQVAAVSAGILTLDLERRTRRERDGESGSRCGGILDLEYLEDSEAEVDANLVTARPLTGGELEIVEFQSTGEGRAFTRHEANQILDLALSGCERLMTAQRDLLG